MDHISANKSLAVTERENISGARVFDGEDQGKCLTTKHHFTKRLVFIEFTFNLMF